MNKTPLYSLLLLVLFTRYTAFGEGVDFNRDIRPVLADKCFTCHGPDANKREADLRLDTKAGAFADLGGYSAFQPGDSENSEALRRIFSDDPDERMPPTDAKLVLSQLEKEHLRQWVAEGAKWNEHWAFVPPARPDLPEVRDASWPRNAIDRFVLARLEKEGLRPSPAASRETLIRRVTLDLTGLPPTPDEVDAFLSDASPNAYEEVVDRLLRSTRYGERMAWPWLDAARYADTDGFQGDPTRTMWPWRDWLIKALNDNLAFDEFTIQMLAGDLLPDATKQQIIATGFNRNHMYNGEGGRIAEETRVENVFDRTETTCTVWLGLTMTCARCHDHKFDPVLQQEYYQFYAFFNNTSESGRGGGGKAPPVVSYLPPQQSGLLASYDGEIASLRARMDALAARSSHSQAWQELQSDLQALEEKRKGIQNGTATVMVMDELPAEGRRKAAILVRGNYNKPELEVREGTPAFLPPLPEDAPRNRLQLAKWLVDASNPLTARVTVNRYWQLFFGTGLVRTSEDFGRQGSPPSHPHLLDYLATQFVASGWDVKAMHRLIVTGATYRQSSRVTDELYQSDPDNRLLARGARYRLPSWMLRDQALALSGLLSERIGGPSVKPYQPADVWAGATFGRIRYQPDEGERLYRRSLYVFWRRIVGPTMFFDSGKRQTCEVKPTRTNTPLHALTTLNEPAFVEAARVMAERVMKTTSDPPENRVAWAFRLATARFPKPAEQSLLAHRRELLTSEFAERPEQAQQLLSVGQAPRDTTLDPAEHAAWTVVCSLILNLDEVLTRE